MYINTVDSIGFNSDSILLKLLGTIITSLFDFFETLGTFGTYITNLISTWMKTLPKNITKEV